MNEGRDTREMIRPLQEACMFCMAKSAKAHNRVDSDISSHMMDEVNVFGIRGHVHMTSAEF